MKKEKILDLIEKHKKHIANHEEKIKYHEHKIEELENKLSESHYQIQLKNRKWKKRRDEILNVKGHYCSKCGSKDNLHIHHLYYENNKKPWEYPDDALIVLCENCHKEIHNVN